MKPRVVDYGWRLQGQTVRTLEDRSFRLTAQNELLLLASSFRDPAAPTACIQCGVCTASCSLAEEGSLFPRPEMELFRLGAHDQLVVDPNIWHCHNCGDCATHCPPGARPDQIMAAFRQMSVRHFSRVGWVGRLLHRPRLQWLAYPAAALLVVAAIAFGGSFAPAADPVHYASLLPHLTLNLFYTVFVGIGLVAMLGGVFRAWRLWTREPFWQVRPLRWLRAMAGTFADVVSHRRFAQCEVHPLRRWAHLGCFYGFIALFVLTTIVAVLDFLGLPYPFPPLHPLKIVGNLAGLLVAIGLSLALFDRLQNTRRGEPSMAFDWFFLTNLLAVVLSGFLAEVFRYATWPALAYSAYGLHLVAVFVLLVLLPWSKLAHVFYRTTAETAKRYVALRTYDDGRRARVLIENAALGLRASRG